MRYIISLLFLALVILFSCDEKPCYENMNTYFKISFYTVEDNIITDTVLDSLKIYADQSNFGFITKFSSSIQAELSPHSDSTLFFITINDNQGDDYINLRYHRIPHLVSHDCGFLTFFDKIEILEYSTFFIDSVEVVNENVDDTQKEHIKIYL